MMWSDGCYHAVVLWLLGALIQKGKFLGLNLVQYFIIFLAGGQLGHC
jgi:hypothetical protein